MSLAPEKDDRVAWLPDLIYADGQFQAGMALVCGADGRIQGFARDRGGAGRVVRLQGRALLPGLVNAHSHAFQRVIRGRTEYRTAGQHDSFWTWRELMYSAAMRLTPDDIYDASRMAFLEMVLGGITAVGEFHYLHRAPDGAEYDQPNLLALEVVRAARDVGLRIALLRVAYARSGYRVEPNPRQLRFIEPTPDVYLRNLEMLGVELARSYGAAAWAGVAPHSVRAAPLGYLREVLGYAVEHGLPAHMHVAEQPAEVSACVEEYGRTPVALLESEGLLGERLTAVHGLHVTPEEVRMLAKRRAGVCACPTTERNLGDGIFPADLYFQEGVRVALGTDSHTQIDLLEDARELEYHLRLGRLQRAVLAPEAGVSALAARLFDCASAGGAESIGASAGRLETGRAADFFTIDLDDPSVAGASPADLISGIVFSSGRMAVREVVVGGRPIVEDGKHSSAAEIVAAFAALQSRLWS